MIKLTYTAHHTVWLGRERFERIVDRIAESGRLPEAVEGESPPDLPVMTPTEAFRREGFEGRLEDVKIGEVGEPCPLLAFCRVVETHDLETIREGKVLLMRLFDTFERNG